MNRLTAWPRVIGVCALLFCGLAAEAKSAPVGAACGSSSLDGGWKFHRGDATGSEAPEASDAGWQSVTLPHDWAIAGPFAAENPSKGQGAFAPMGIGWYRRHLPTPGAGCTRTAVRFDGVMANSDVWINGHALGHRPNGYATFRYELTPYLNKGAGADNVIAVRADNAQQPSSRFYQGAGIYRHVHLLRYSDVHFVPWSTYVTASEVTAKSATVKVQTEVRNESGVARLVALRISLSDAAGHVVARTLLPSRSIEAGTAEKFSWSAPVAKPALWDVAHPAMYHASVEVVGGDRDDVAFGIRDAHFKAATGFWLNGRNIKIKGVALHSDIGALGMAVPLSLWEHRLRAMQSMGANAVRTAHNEVAPEFLELCDRLGILVLDEYFDMWTVAKNPYDYHLYFRDWYLRDTHDGVMRDRNHPSVIAWSAGNEIHDTPRPEVAKPILAALVDQYHKDDPSRPVTQALFRPNVSHDYQDGLADLLDVVGQNYRPNEILAAHAEKPSRKILGTENIHDRESWLAVRDHAEYAGLFVWSGTDYLGESRQWPLIGDASGLFDRTDFPKADALEHEAWWSEQPVVHIVRRVAPQQKAPTDPGYEAEQYRPKQVLFADWTPTDRSDHTEHIEVYSNCAHVALKLNGKSLGSKELAADAAPRTWDIAFAPGDLEARCEDTAGTQEVLRTAEQPAAIVLKLETPAVASSFDDVGFVRATVVDAHGTVVPLAGIPLEFRVSGVGILLATDNADNAYTAPFASASRESFHGRAVAFVRGTSKSGVMRVEASSPGLQTGVLAIRVGPNLQKR